MPSISNIRGYTLLELLLGITLTGILSTGLFHSLNAGLEFSRAALEKSKGSHSISVFTTVMQQGLARSSGLAAIPGIRLTATASLPDAFGRGNILTGTSPATQPKVDSGTITFIEFASEFQLRTQAVQHRSGTAVALLLCGAATLKSATGPQQFLLSGVDGYLQAQGTIRRRRNDPACSPDASFTGDFRFVGRPLFGELFRPLASDEVEDPATLLSITSVVPIRDAYTLYVDTTGRLRRRSHTTQENQAIAEGFLALHTVCEGANNNLCTLEIELLQHRPQVRSKRMFSIYVMPAKPFAFMDVVF